MKSKLGFLERSAKLAGLTRQRELISKISNERKCTINDIRKIKRIVGEHCQQLFT